MKLLRHKKVQVIESILFSVGLSLVGLNTVGILTPLRNPEIYRETRTGFKEDITLNEQQVYEAIKRENESNETYIVKLNSALNRGIAHYWHDEGTDKYNLRIPVRENYLLFLASYLYPQVYKKYVYYDYRKAIERGVGRCSQQSLIVSQILEENGIESRIVALDGHVVAMARVDKETGTWWVVDPDYGVVVKHDMREIEKNPDRVRPYYAEKGSDPHTIDLLVSVYEKTGNRIIESAKVYQGRKYYFEKLSYIAIWVIPLILFLLYALSRLRRVRARQKAQADPAAQAAA